MDEPQIPLAEAHINMDILPFHDPGPDLTLPLPTELLIEIFTLVTYTKFEDLQDLVEPDYYACRWGNILSTCRRWREVAIATPSLWTSIHLSWPRHVISTFLERNTGSHIDVALNEDILEAAFDPVDGDGDGDDDFPLALGRMERLNICWDPLIGYDEFLDVVHGLPHINWEGSLERFTALYSRNVAMRLNMVWLLPRNLRHVNIRCSDVSIHILNFLSSDLTLDTLILHEDLDDNSIPIPPNLIWDPNAPIVDLSLIKQLSIGWCHPEFFDMIYPRLTRPVTTELVFSINRHEFSTVLTSIPLSCLDFFRLSTSLSIHCDPHNRYSTTPTYPFIIQCSALDMGVGPFHFNFNEWEGGENRSEELTHLYHELTTSQYSCNHLTSLNLSTTNLPYATILIKLFEPLISLHELIVRTLDVGPLFVALELRASASGVPLCPELVSLDIRKSQFNPWELLDVLRERHQLHLPNRKLKKLQLTVGAQFRAKDLRKPKKSAKRRKNAKQRKEGLAVVFRELKNEVEDYNAEEGLWLSEEALEDVIV
ncbi:hypothetical protein SISNIDRAFT_453103 [Sistotremastrum niveocremeum HHB9708]|uniref:F-box domain-containing protein n=1 Tax=Sistotremastrum niveocremeum HHB9708 TaxID=1314777 RepID=A0A164WCN2_9AGAM|nr:hypothetical protein SISNIDRAFT_453103 [Sistotremastrum niveocremeum HHB9708]